MIIGSVNVYNCDGAECSATRVVPVEMEEQFEQEWHSGLAHHFCPSCKNRVDNAAAILADEIRLQKLRASKIDRLACGCIVSHCTRHASVLQEVKHAA